MNCDNTRSKVQLELESDINPCEPGTVPREVRFGDIVVMGNGQSGWNPARWIESSQDSAFPIGFGLYVTAGNNTNPTEIIIKNEENDDVDDGIPLRSGDVILLEDNSGNERYMNPKSGFNRNFVLFESDAFDISMTPKWIITKVSGFSPVGGNSDVIHFGDVFTLSSVYARQYGTRCKGTGTSEICQSLLFCSENILDSTKCRWVCDSGACDVDDLNRPGSLFSFFNTEKGITCQTYQKDVCAQKKCPDALCPDGKLVCRHTQRPVLCDENTQTYYCACSPQGGCPSGYVCDTDSNMCILNPNTRCTRDAQCTQYNRVCGSSGLCVDCNVNEDCSKDQTCSDNVCSTSPSNGDSPSTIGVILSIVMILAVVGGILWFVYSRWHKNRQQQSGDNVFSVDLSEIDLSLHNRHKNSLHLKQQHPFVSLWPHRLPHSYQNMVAPVY